MPMPLLELPLLLLDLDLRLENMGIVGINIDLLLEPG
jgi:hypothetical protein